MILADKYIIHHFTLVTCSGKNSLYDHEAT
jgi:hypothetical protein